MLPATIAAYVAGASSRNGSRRGKRVGTEDTGPSLGSRYVSNYSNLIKDPAVKQALAEDAGWTLATFDVKVSERFGTHVQGWCTVFFVHPATGRVWDHAVELRFPLGEDLDKHTEKAVDNAWARLYRHLRSSELSADSR